VKRVLVIDGGGLKGFIPLQVLQHIEWVTKRPIWETFDLIVGTSVGAILGGLFACGGLDANAVVELMDDTAPDMFKRRPWPLLPKYSRKKFLAAWGREVPDMTIGDCPTKLMTTSVNLCDGRTHYFKSDDPKDAPLSLVDAVTRSFAAPMFFGGIVDEDRKAVWLDGGTGVDNCPLLEALYEVVARGWVNERTHVLSLGCGFVREGMSFKRARRRVGKTVREVVAFMDPKEGGMARQQSIDSRVSIAHRIVEVVPGLTMQRLDVKIPAKIDKLDGREYIKRYREFGRALAGQVDVTLLQ